MLLGHGTGRGKSIVSGSGGSVCRQSYSKWYKVGGSVLATGARGMGTGTPRGRWKALSVQKKMAVSGIS